MAISIFSKRIDELTEDKNADEWIWVEGFKGTKKDMTCHGGYQYELGKQHDMPEDAKIEECSSGFHLCLNLRDVFDYYSIGDDRRFFKVRALVRKGEAESYGRRLRGRDKLAARAIEFISECTIDEIFQALSDAISEHDRARLATWTLEDKILALTIGVPKTRLIVDARALVELGYSKPFATFLAEENMFSLAEAVGSQTDLSMDMKVWMIMMAIQRRDANVDRIKLESNLLRKSLNF